MMRCSQCSSYAINPGQHGRDDTDLNLCDVCYWRKRATLAVPPQPMTPDAHSAVDAAGAAMNALRALEQACDDLAAAQTRDGYLLEVARGRETYLVALDDARREARRVLFAARSTAQKPGHTASSAQNQPQALADEVLIAGATGNLELVADKALALAKAVKSSVLINGVEIRFAPGHGGKIDAGELQPGAFQKPAQRPSQSQGQRAHTEGANHESE